MITILRFPPSLGAGLKLFEKQHLSVFVELLGYQLYSKKNFKGLTVKTKDKSFAHPVLNDGQISHLVQATPNPIWSHTFHQKIPLVEFRCLIGHDDFLVFNLPRTYLELGGMGPSFLLFGFDKWKVMGS